MTPEAKVKKQVTNILKSFGAYYFTPVTGGFGRSGIPDIVACYRGHFIGIECKAGKGVPTALQLKNLQDIKDQGGVSVVVKEDNVHVVQEILSCFKNGENHVETSRT
jgi:hypothetical protein